MLRLETQTHQQVCKIPRLNEKLRHSLGGGVIFVSVKHLIAGAFYLMHCFQTPADLSIQIENDNLST